MSAVNVRAGPDRFFPTVTWVLSGTAAKVHGCVDSWRWCDVTVGRDRGWIYAAYLSVAHEGRKVTIVQGGPTLGMPVVDFDVARLLERALRRSPLGRPGRALPDALGTPPSAGAMVRASGGT